MHWYLTDIYLRNPVIICKTQHDMNFRQYILFYRERFDAYHGTAFFNIQAMLSFDTIRVMHYAWFCIGIVQLDSMQNRRVFTEIAFVAIRINSFLKKKSIHATFSAMVHGGIRRGKITVILCSTLHKSLPKCGLSLTCRITISKILLAPTRDQDLIGLRFLMRCKILSIETSAIIWEAYPSLLNLIHIKVQT